MSELRELYQELIIDHGRKPRNFGKLETANHIKEGYNPLCGDQLTVYLCEKDGIVTDVKFEGVGCAISMASASLMTQALIGKTTETVQKLFDSFHQLMIGAEDVDVDLGKLQALAGVSEFPARVKCATLCWHTAMAAMHDDNKLVSTE